MKKLAIATILALAAGSASAFDVGVSGGRANSLDENLVGVSVGKKFGLLGVSAGYDRLGGNVDQNRYSLMGSVDLFKVEKVQFAAKAGYAYLDNKHGVNGNAFVFGVGASMPVAKKVAATLDVVRQQGENKVEAFDSNMVTVGVKVRF